jgi:hypothetical protein
MNRGDLMFKFQKLMQYCIDNYYNSYTSLFKGLIDIDKLAENRYNYKLVFNRLTLLHQRINNN